MALSFWTHIQGIYTPAKECAIFSTSCKAIVNNCMTNKETPIDWEGTSYSDLMAFPADAKHSAGFQLGRLQAGLDPADWKPLTGLANDITGVKEIRIWSEDGGYRVAYATKFGDVISVLHCFEKKTQQTEKKDIDLIVKRYKEARERHQRKK